MYILLFLACAGPEGLGAPDEGAVEPDGTADHAALSVAQPGQPATTCEVEVSFDGLGGPFTPDEAMTTGGTYATYAVNMVEESDACGRVRVSRPAEARILLFPDGTVGVDLGSAMTSPNAELIEGCTYTTGIPGGAPGQYAAQILCDAAPVQIAATLTRDASTGMVVLRGTRTEDR